MHFQGDRLYSEVVSSRRPTLTVRSEIGPYRRPITALSPRPVDLSANFTPELTTSFAITCWY